MSYLLPYLLPYLIAMSYLLPCLLLHTCTIPLPSSCTLPSATLYFTLYFTHVKVQDGAIIFHFPISLSCVSSNASRSVLPEGKWPSSSNFSLHPLQLHWRVLFLSHRHQCLQCQHLPWVPLISKTSDACQIEGTELIQQSLFLKGSSLAALLS